MSKTKKEIIEEIIDQCKDGVIRKELAMNYWKQVKGNTKAYTNAMAAEMEMKQLQDQVEFFTKEYENLGTDGLRTE